MMVEKPMTTGELFSRIQDILKEKGKLPDILDYGLETYHPLPIRTYQFDLKNNLAYGGSEGIYLDLWIEYFFHDENCTSGIGTFKTLATDNGAMHTMAALLADFIIEMSEYVNANIDDFTWEGADVYAIDENDRRVAWGYSCNSMEQALKAKGELLEKYLRVVVRDNATREKKIFCKNGEEKRYPEKESEVKGEVRR